uniref:AAA+ ATPase domain-containing protein n=1 Tax=Cyprinodon variegatus TaxID=28743 RepID=A0A3Q2DSJ3_CYPVA
YGQKDVKKPNRTILLVGETGTGKSTLINALVNYAMGVKFEDEVWFQTVEDEKRSQTESQTSDVIVYQIFGFEDQTLPFSLTIIDTPGFGDTRGLERDENVSQRLLDLFRSEDGVQEIHAVGLVIKAAENRLSDRLLYIFDSVMDLFGKDVEKNIVALVTHSDGTTPGNALKALEDADIKCAKDGNNQPVYFLFNNLQKTERDTEKKTGALKHSWDFTNKQIQNFTAYLDTSQPQKLATTVKVLNERIRLTACIQNLQERVELSEQKQREIKQIQEALKNNENEIKKNENFTIEVDVTYKVRERIIGGTGWTMSLYNAAVCCERCEENCHYPGCTMALYAWQCEVMKEGCCTVCTGKCPASDHVKEKWKYVNKTKKVEKTVEDLKEKYEKNKAECENKLSLLENLEEEYRKLSAERSMYLDEAYQHFIKLEQIALNVESVSTFVHLDFLIEKLEEKGDTFKVERL